MDTIQQKGFIQIPILIAIIVGVTVIGGTGYFGARQYISYQLEKGKLAQEVAQLKSEREKTELQAKEQASRAGDIKKLQEQITSSKKQNQSQAAIKKLSNKEIIEKVKPAVVYISRSTKGGGSGMIIQENGLILTNAHVVKDTDSIVVKLTDSRTFDGIVIGRDEYVDLALVKVNGAGLPIVELGNSDAVAQGDVVFTLGYPFGLRGDVSFKEGTISRRLSFEGSTWLETSAEIHPGNSGGPLVNEFGQVIGVNTQIIGVVVEDIILGESIKLAIPVNVTKNYLPELRAGRNAVQPKPPIVTPKPVPPRSTPTPVPPPQAQILSETICRQQLGDLGTYDNSTNSCICGFGTKLFWNKCYMYRTICSELHGSLSLADEQGNCYCHKSAELFDGKCYKK